MFFYRVITDCRWCALVVVFFEHHVQHRRDGTRLLQRHSLAEKVRGKTRDDRQLVKTACSHQPDDHMDDRVHMLK